MPMSMIRRPARTTARVDVSHRGGIEEVSRRYRGGIDSNDDDADDASSSSRSVAHRIASHRIALKIAFHSDIWKNSRPDHLKMMNDDAMDA